MSQLLRIILINTHLTGVVEIQMDQHTNICGTNASGKTTLQRLVPVFYGELPSRVVPKTRKKFDEFYLPFTNSYLIYEYRRDRGAICQAVLTKKSDGGLEYRFVGFPYQSEHYLEKNDQGINAYSYADWANNLRQVAAGLVSHKITATSEYRSIIQNDTTALKGNNADSLKLRRAAGNFSLVSGSHKLRHIEKLVSAVHAKEGKMDTLKSMLAAIFAEDGVTLPTTKVKNTKAREWIRDMRQSMKLAELEANFAQLQQQAQHLDSMESQLAALRPLLHQDLEAQKIQQADSQAQMQALQGQLRQLDTQFKTQESALFSDLAKAKQDLNEVVVRLDHIQTSYAAYESKDMTQLQRDTDALPLWRENLAQLQEQYRLIAEQHDDLERQLEQRKFKLAESLERLSQQQRVKAKQLQQQKDQVREAQDTKLASLEQGFQNRIQAQQSQFAQQQAARQSALAVLQNTLAHSPLTPAELDELQLAEARLEQAQTAAQQHNRDLQNLQQQKQAAQQARDLADQQLITQRQSLQQAEVQLQQLHRQLTPEEGSLRHFLRLNYPDWQHSLGKVLHENLLERQDLQPNLIDLDASTAITSIYGLKLDLNALALPDYAQDELAIQLRIKSAEQQLANVQQQKEQAEKVLQACHAKFQQLSAQVDKAQQQSRDSDANIDYVRDARDRLKTQQQQQVSQRQATTRQQLTEQQQQLEALVKQQQHNLEAMHQDHVAQRLELKADWQTELSDFDAQLAQLDAQLTAKREENLAQLKELEQAFAEELSAKGIDPQRLNDLKQRQQQLQTNIYQVQERHSELQGWLEFMRVSWQTLRPELLAQETQHQQKTRDLNLAITQLKTTYAQQQQGLEAQKNQQQAQINQLESLMSQLKPLLIKLDDLPLQVVEPAVLGETFDLTERLARTTATLDSRSSQDRQFGNHFEQFDNLLKKDAGIEILNRLDYEKNKLPKTVTKREQLPMLNFILDILKSEQQGLLGMGENIGGDLKKFFTVFSDINRRIAQQSRRLSEAVNDDLVLDGIRKSDVKILSTIDELGFWQPLKHFAKHYDDWQLSGKTLPSDDYLNALADVVELIRSDENYSIESLLRLELHLNEGGSDLVIKNDRQLLESSSHGMAYLILCKYLLAFTRLLRGEAAVTLHWPIDEIGTLAYHNVEKLFQACSKNKIIIVGAFPNPESDVLTLFEHRYLIEPSQEDPSQRQLKRIQPQASLLEQRLAERQAQMKAQQTEQQQEISQ